jgi:hypothetical protein
VSADAHVAKVVRNNAATKSLIFIVMFLLSVLEFAIGQTDTGRQEPTLSDPVC